VVRFGVDFAGLPDDGSYAQENAMIKLKFLLLFFIAMESAWAVTPATQPAGTITLYHSIVTADDNGIFVRGMAEVVAQASDRPIVIRLAGAENLQVQSSLEMTSAKINGDQVELSSPLPEDGVKLEFQYFCAWPADSAKPIILSLPTPLPIDTVMVSLSLAGLKFETQGLKKTHLESQEVYTAFDLIDGSTVAVLVYPPKPWWGVTAGRYVIGLCVLIIIVFSLLKIGRRRHG
jgi:hypothetical protein